MKLTKSLVNTILSCLIAISIVFGTISPAIGVLADTVTLNTPTGVQWLADSTATATWDTVEGANYYKVSVIVSYDGTQIGTQETGTADSAIDVQDIIHSVVGDAGYQTVSASFQVQAVQQEGGVDLLTSEWSSSSDLIEYNLVSAVKLATPTGVSLSSDMKVTFNSVPNADCYYINVYNAENTAWEECIYSDAVYFNEDGTLSTNCEGTASISNGVITADISKGMPMFLAGTDYVNKDLKLYCRVQAQILPQNLETKIPSDMSAASGTVSYKVSTGKKVETINISPKTPYVYIGGTYSLGKTVLPIDAYYTAINWTSNNKSIVTVDSLGKLTGVAAGTATVTAKVDNASDSATVTVYKLETNVDEESKIDVFNNTNVKINSIVVGNASGTDISNTKTAAALIVSGMKNKDEFHVDLIQDECSQDYSSAGWKKIEGLYNSDPDYNPTFADSVDVSIELYTENKYGVETTVGNITEFDTDIQFELDIPKDLPAVQSGYARVYSVVRVHNGKYDVLECTANPDNTVTVESDKFSDFVLVYDDIPIPSFTGGKAHVQDIGDTGITVDPVTGMMTIGTRGQGRRLEEIVIDFENNTPYSGTLQYRVHVQDIGWMDWTNAGGAAGTEGIAKRIEAIEMRLTGELADFFSVEYCVHIQDYGDMQGWVNNGALAGTTGESKRIEEIKVRIVPNGSDETMSVMYRVHVQDYGWENSYASNGQMSGTTGQSKRLEGIEIFLTGCQYTGGIKYKTHVENYGWESSWVKDGEMSGTQGQSLRLEGIAIELYGEVAEYYDVYYRVHAQDIGWMSWAKNGAYAGTAGRSARLEGIQIVLVPKGSPAPGATYAGITAVATAAFVEGF